MLWIAAGRWFGFLLGIAAAALVLSGHFSLGAWLGFAASGLEVASFGIEHRDLLGEPVTFRSLFRRAEWN